MLLALPPAGAQTGSFDYDTDDDGLIDVRTPGQLGALRVDPDGNGARDAVDVSNWGAFYLSVYPLPLSGMGCPAAGCTGYELLSDLDLSSSNNWEPIGTSTAPYTATFDGNGHRVSGLTTSRSSAAAGLFGNLGSGGIIKNLGVVNASVTISGNASSAGAIIGILSAGALLYSSYASGGTVTAAADSTTTGGLVGGNTGGAIRASYSTNAVTISGTQDNNDLGGLAGYSRGTIVASYAAGAVSGTGGTGNTYAGFVGNSSTAGAAITHSYCDSTVAGTLPCVGRQTNSSNVTVAAHATADLKRPTGYTGIYANWNIDTDGDGSADDPWYFGSRRQYPAPYYRQPPPPRPPPYNPAHDHPEIYTNPRHQMATSCAVQTTGEGDEAKSTSTLTFNLGSYTRPITLALSLWDGTHFRSLQSQGISMPELRQEGRTATVEVVTDPAQTRFRLDSEYGLNLVLGYADCHTDDP